MFYKGIRKEEFLIINIVYGNYRIIKRFGNFRIWCKFDMILEGVKKEKVGEYYFRKVTLESVINYF